jgi:hypothetical protein
MQHLKQPAFSKTFRRAKPILIALVLSFFATGAAAAPSADGALMTGGALLILCTSEKSEDVFSCQTYIAGVVDYHRLQRSLGTVPTVDFCLPDGITMGDIKSLVVRYLYKYTEHRDFIAAPAVAMALFQQFPCKRRK